MSTSILPIAEYNTLYTPIVWIEYLCSIVKRLVQLIDSEHLELVAIAKLAIKSLSEEEVAGRGVDADRQRLST